MTDRKTLRKRLPIPGINAEFKWKDWQETWAKATSTAVLLGLLHDGFRYSINHSHSGYGEDSVKTQRHRTYLHIADIDSGYPREVREKAFNQLFGGTQKVHRGILPDGPDSKRKELRTLVWFLRRKPSDYSWEYGFANQETIDGASKQARERFLSGVDEFFPRLWACSIGGNLGYKTLRKGLLRNAVLKIVLLRSVRTGKIPLVEELCLNLFFHDMVGCQGNDLEILNARLAGFDRSSLDIIERDILIRFKSRGDALRAGDKIAFLLPILQELRQEVRARLVLEAAEAEIEKSAVKARRTGELIAEQQRLARRIEQL